jgi:hypothetical protein
METCIAPFLLKSYLLFRNASDHGNLSEAWTHRFWPESSDKRLSAQYLRPKHDDATVREANENGVESQRAKRRDRKRLGSKNPRSKLILVCSEGMTVATCDAGEHVKETVDLLPHLSTLCKCHMFHKQMLFLKGGTYASGL